MTRPRLLDLFCGEGGSCRGFQIAGFDVTGVDLARRCAGRYPGRFVQGDAVAFAQNYAGDFDAISASPPCKLHSSLAVLHPEDTDEMLFPLPTHEDQIPATRAALAASGRPYLIENVPGAPLLDPVMLCGSMFGLGVICDDGIWRQLRRHRLFEATVPLTPPGPCQHTGQAAGVYGHGAGKAPTRSQFQTNKREALDAIDAHWMTRDGVSQAIPPAYTEWLGLQLLAAITTGAAA